MDEGEKNDQFQKAPDEKKTATHDAMQKMKLEAEKALQEIKGKGGVKALFSFDTMYFPTFARVFFIVFCVIAALFGAIGILLAFISMTSVGLLAGLGNLLGIVIGTVLTIVMVRFWIELVLVAFKMNEALQDIREQLHAKRD